MTALRPHQTRAIEAVRDAYRRRVRRVLLVMPTGAGKTFTAAELIRRAVEGGRTVLFLVHRREIVMDTHRRLSAAGVPCGLVIAGKPASIAPVQVASVQTIAAREEHPPADLVVWDEAHHTAAESYRTIAAQYPTAWHLGLTATPERADGVGLRDAFDELVVGATVAELTGIGLLAPCDVLAPPKRQGGLADDPAEAWARLSGARPTVAFCRSVSESLALAVAITERGYRARHIDGSTSTREREEALSLFASGRVDVLTNVFVLTEGWDCLDEDTEVLAADGWRSIGEIAPGDMIESLNIETGRMEAVPCDECGERAVRADERMARIKSQHADIRTTEGHRYYFKYRDPKRGGALSDAFLVKTGAELAARRSAYALPLAAERADPFPGVPLSDDELRFVAWFMTDGGFQDHGRAVVISQAKGFKDEIRALLARLGFDFKERVRAPGRQAYANGKPLHEFTIPKGTGTARRKGWFGRFSRYLDKNVAAALHEMTRHQFAVFWREMLKGDGEQQGMRSGWLWCDRQEQADAYTAMAVRRGFSASYSTRITKNGHEMFRVSVRERAWLTSDPADARAARISLESPAPDERVWCVTNRNGTLVTRRNGKIAILGNCPRAKVCLLARGCGSEGTYLQMVGRVLRPAGEERALVIDLAGVVHEHGLPAEVREFSLDGIRRKPREERPWIAQCRACGLVVEGEKRGERCPRCGGAWPPPPRAKVERATLSSAAPVIVPRAEKQAEFKRLVGIARERKYAIGWAGIRFKERFGHWPKGLS